jgi:hypothetical protein
MDGISSTLSKKVLIRIRPIDQQWCDIMEDCTEHFDDVEPTAEVSDVNIKVRMQVWPDT